MLATHCLLLLHPPPAFLVMIFLELTIALTIEL